MKYPIVCKSLLHHWGTLDSKNINKNGNSFEGNSLSLSTCPNDWAKLLRLNENDRLFKFEKTDSQFVDILSLLQDEKYTEKKNQIIQDCIKNGYLENKDVFKYEFQDESDQIYHTFFETEEEALMEAADEEDIQKIKKYIGTEKLRRLSGINKENSLLSGEEHAVIEYIKSEKDIDGIFWNYKEDVNNYSLPIYSIFQHKVKEWKASEESQYKHDKKKKFKYK